MADADDAEDWDADFDIGFEDEDDGDSPLEEVPQIIGMVAERKTRRQ